MRRLLIAGALLLGLCACAAARQMQIPGDNAHPVVGNANAPWRAVGESSDRAVAHACLISSANCESLIQTTCLSGYSADEQSPALARRCDWRAMAAWEDEVLALLADVRGKLAGDDLKNLNDAETAWETSMLADVGLGMDLYSGGSLSGPVGAHIRARATALHAAYLYEIQQMVSGE